MCEMPEAPDLEGEDAPTADEARLFDMINGSRAAAGVQILARDPATARVARLHCIDMRDRGFQGHENPEGERVSQRLDRAGVVRRTQGECVAVHLSVEAAHFMFMHEPFEEGTHHWVILWPHFTHMGIGVVPDGRGALLITEDFIMREPEGG